MSFAVPEYDWVKTKEGEKRYEYLYLAWELKKPKEQESNGDIKCNWFAWNDPPKAW